MRKFLKNHGQEVVCSIVAAAMAICMIVSNL